MTEKLKFIHASDLHLDSPFQGLSDLPEHIFSQVKDSTFHALENLVDTAIEHKVDFVLLVGDLFDHERQSLKAQVKLRGAFEKLKEHNINVYLSYGNHDFLTGNIYPITYPENVFIFQSEEVSSFTYEKDGEKLAKIYGFSYEKRAVTENKAVDYKIEDVSIPFHIATLHGSLYGNKQHAPYASFRLTDLHKEPFDYWALGHIHQREILSEQPPIIYPGNIQGRHRHETGEKGCYLVELSKTETNYTFIPLQTIIFENKIIDVSDCEQMDELERKLRKLFEEVHDRKLIYLTLYSNNERIYSFETEGFIQQIIELLNESYATNDTWHYIYDYQIETDRVEQKFSNHFFVKELYDTFKKLDMQEELEDLYHHHVGRKFLEPIAHEEVKEEAKRYLFHHLLKVKEGE